MDPGRYLVELNNAVALMTDTVNEIDVDAIVPTCPGWSLTDLVDHLGRTHLWAAQAARTGQRPEPYPIRDQGSRTLAQWYADCGQEVVETLSGLDPADPAWTISRDNRTVGFWQRRQLHETTIHWVDALLAAGQPLPGSPALTSEVAVDGIDEALTFFLARQLARADREQVSAIVPGPITIICTDTGSAWTIAPTDSGITLRAIEAEPAKAEPAKAEEAGAEARLTGSAIDVYLALWNRADRGGLELLGNQRVGHAFLTAPLVP